MQKAENHFRSLQKLNDWSNSPILMNQQATMTGTINATVPFEALILIGLFAKPIPEGLPILRYARFFVRGFLYNRCQTRRLLLNGYLCPLGNAGYGLSASAKNLKDSIEKADHRRIIYLLVPHQEVILLSSKARRSTTPNLIVSVDESFSSEST